MKSGKGYFKVFSRKVFFKRLNEFKRDIRNQERKSEVDLRRMDGTLASRDGLVEEASLKRKNSAIENTE